MLPAMHPPSGQVPAAFTPGLWADHVLDTFIFSHMGKPLSPSDRWKDEFFDEAVAFAHVLKVSVILPVGRDKGSCFRLSTAGRPPVTIAQCSPTELIAALRAYVSGTLVGLPPTSTTSTTSTTSITPSSWTWRTT